MANGLKKLNICHSANLADLCKMAEVLDTVIQLICDARVLSSIFYDMYLF